MDASEAFRCFGAPATRGHNDSRHAAYVTQQSSMNAQAEVAKGRTGIMGVLPPHSSGKRPASLSSCFTRSGLAPSLSICMHQDNGCHLIYHTCGLMFVHHCCKLRICKLHYPVTCQVSTWNLTCHVSRDTSHSCILVHSAVGSVFCANRWWLDRFCSWFKVLQDTVSSLMLTTSYVDSRALNTALGLMQCLRILGQHANAQMPHVCFAAALQSSCLECSLLLTQLCFENNVSICIDHWHFYMLLCHLITNDHCHTTNSNAEDTAKQPTDCC